MITKEEEKNRQNSSVEIKEKERIDDLQRNGYRIIQNPEKFCFGMDAVLLSGFARESAKSPLYHFVIASEKRFSLSESPSN